MTERGVLPFPSLRAKRGNPSSKRKNEDAISVLDCFVTFAPRNDGARVQRYVDEFGFRLQ